MHLRSGGSSKEEEKSLNQILCTQAIQIGILLIDRELANAIQGITLSLFSATSRHLPNLKHITSCYVIQVHMTQIDRII